MSDDAGQEPSMEEILASIRKIISEDGEEEVAEAEPEPEPAPEPVFEEDDALELTDEFEPEPIDEILTVSALLPAISLPKISIKYSPPSINGGGVSRLISPEFPIDIISGNKEIVCGDLLSSAPP